VTANAIAPPVGIRSGPRYWWGSLSAMLRWQLTSMRLLLPLLVIVQMLIAAGFSVGMSMFFTEVTPTVALYLGTGSAIIALIIVGLIVAPQLIAVEKEEDTYDFTWSLPTPRSAAVVAWLVLCAIVSIPAMIAALAVASWRLDIVYSVNPTIVPAVLLVLICGTMIGYAMAHAIPKPGLTQLLTQVLAFGVLGFTPITFPIENLPSWLANIQEVLPFYHMGVIVRGGLTDGLVDDLWMSYLVVLGWSLAAIVLVALVLGRRK
jgi:ABC-2 type transport system permease protein